MAQEAPLIGGVVGAIIGAYFGEPAIGWMIGSAIGGLFVPKPVTHALTDLTVQTSQYGAGLPQIFGTQRTAGNVIWASERQWISLSAGGKGGKGGGGGGGKGGGGGGGQGQGYYLVSLAVAICEGPVMGVKRIWTGGDLIFDDGQQVLVPSRASGGKKGGTTAPSYQTFNANNGPVVSSGGSAIGNWVLYHGTLDQPPDPTVNQGIAYGGICYIVFNQMYLGAGGAIPPLTFEVVQPVNASYLNPPAIVDTFSPSVTVNGKNESLGTGIPGTPIVDSLGNPLQCTPGWPGENWWVKLTPTGVPMQAGPVLGSSAAGQNINFMQYGGQSFGALDNGNHKTTLYGIDPDTGITNSMQPLTGIGSGTLGYGILAVDSEYVYCGDANIVVAITPNGTEITQLGTWAVAYNGGTSRMLAEILGYLEGSSAACNGIFCGSGSGGVTFWNVATGATQVLTTLGTTVAATTDGNQFWLSYTQGSQNYLVNATVNALQTATDPIVTLGTPVPVSTHLMPIVWVDGKIWGAINSGARLLQIDPATGAQLNSLNVGASAISYDGTYIWTYDGNYHRIDPGGRVLTPGATTLPEAITVLCQRAGIVNYDISRLPSTPVNFIRQDTTDARSILKVLSTAYLFDMVDSAGTLTFVPHGTASVATIPLADLGFGPDTPTAQPPYAATRQQGIDLPRSVRVRYRSAALNWNKYEQMFALESYDEGREVVIDLPLTLDDPTAYNIASLACCIPHIERMQYAFTTSLKWLALEPGDVVTLPFGVCRILTVRMKRSAEAYLEFTACIDGLNALAGSGLAVPALPNYQPNIVANYAPVNPSGTQSTIPTVGGSTPHPVETAPPMVQAIPNPGAVKLVFCEPPPLDSLDTTRRFYVGAYTTGNTFPGAGVYVSTDGGQSYSLLTTETAATMTGYASSILPTPIPADANYTWDTISTVDVYVSGGQLSNATDQQVFSGANAAMLGDELIQFGVATLKTDSFGASYYTLSRLLRGRRGTGWAMGSHALNDQVVFILGALTEEPYTNAMLNNPRLYKVVMMGQSYAGVPAVSYEPSGASLTPWAVAHPQAVLGPDNEWTISWTPVARINGDFTSGYTPTLDSDAAGWSLDVLKNGSVVRTVNLPVGSTPSAWQWVYTGAMQNADGFAAGSQISIVLYQLSSAIGRGIPRSFTT
jgi:hypothetical protein